MDYNVQKIFYVSKFNLKYYLTYEKTQLKKKFEIIDKKNIYTYKKKIALKVFGKKMS